MKIVKHHTIDPAELERQWPAPYVARTQPILDRATGGLVNAKTLTNLDSLGKGPKGRVRMGRKVAYPSGEFFTWLADRLKPAAEVGRAIGEEA
jgi:hypothetical protein